MVWEVKEYLAGVGRLFLGITTALITIETGRTVRVR
jgi:hypothetical protein